MRSTRAMRVILRYCLLAAAFACCGLAAAGGMSAAAMAAPIPAYGGTGWARMTGGSPVMKAVTRRHGVVRRRKARAKDDAEAAAPPQLPPNVTLRAALADGAAPLREGLSWRVFRTGPAPAAKKLIWSGGGAEPKIHLEPGGYRVEAEYGLAQNALDIDVDEDKPLETTLVLNAGTIRARGAAVPGGPALRDMFFVLRSAAPQANTADVGRSALAEAVFHVPAGAYRLHAQHGFASTEIAVSVEAGREASAEAVMNTGVLALSARAKHDEPPLSGAAFTVYEDSDAAGRREIARSVRDEPRFDMPAGRYRVTAVLGLAREERKVQVTAGKEKAEAFLLDAGGIRLSSILAGNRQPLDRHLLYTVFSLSHGNGNPNHALATTTHAAPTLFLKGGKYRIESQYGWHNARQVREVEVKAGETADVGFEHLACDVTLKLVDKPGGTPVGQVKWTLKYSGGGTVLISQDATPALILQAGSYQAMAQHDTKTFSRIFEAAANSEQTIELIIE